jgi:diguanylate cyclase (GGDEF)-like protein/PAS domain S-box-containing protein
VADGGSAAGPDLGTSAHGLPELASAVAADSAVLLRALLDHMAGVVYVRDARQGRYLLVNTAFEALVGATADEILGRTPHELFPAVTADEYRVNDLAVLAAGGTQISEVTAPHPDGTVHRYVSQKFALFTDDGEPYAVAGLSADVTDLARAREALAESEDRYRALVEGSPIGVVVHIGGRVTYANRAAARLVGATDLEGRQVVSMLPPAEHARAHERSAAYLAGESAKTSRWQVLTDAGEERTLEVTAVGVRFQGAAAIQMEIRDATEQAAAEESIRANEERFRAIFTRSPLPMGVSDPSGRLVSVNPAMCAVLGHGEAYLLGRSLDEFTHEEDTRLRGAVPAGNADGVERCYRHRSGRAVWGLLTVTELGGDGRRYTLTQVENITDRKTAEALLRHQAEHDALTGLPNRATLGERLAAIGPPELAGTAVFFVDLDGFKLLNDGRGHAAGDAVLVEVGARLRSAVRPHDLVSRFGGDEFVVVCRDLYAAADRVAVAGRIEAALALPITYEGEIVTVTASVGVAHGSADLEDAAVLLRRADAAMYSAKRHGKDRVEVYDEDLHAAEQSRARTEVALRHALAEERVTVHYQPLVDLGTGEIIGAEALVRLLDRDGQLLPPDQFIGVAEESGLIVPLGTWVLRQACHQTAAWRAETGRPLCIAVNLSARQAARSDLLVTVLSALEEAGLDHSALFLELTESALLEANDATLTQLTSLRDLGVGIGIDDFGTGYSSLRYLREFPVTFLKVDRTFVQGVPGVAGDVAVVAAVIGLARALGLDCVAEGVETAEQFDTLRDMGAGLGQGYLFSPPVPAEEWGALLAPAAGPIAGPRARPAVGRTPEPTPEQGSGGTDSPDGTDWPGGTDSPGGTGPPDGQGG